MREQQKHRAEFMTSFFVRVFTQVVQVMSAEFNGSSVSNDVSFLFLQIHVPAIDNVVV